MDTIYLWEYDDHSRLANFGLDMYNHRVIVQTKYQENFMIHV